MPTNDDTLIIPTIAGAEDLTAAEAAVATNIARVDLIQVYDVSTSKHKAITVEALATALGLTITP